MAIEHINEFDTLNAGREKINKHAIDPANRAELNSIDARSVANQANQTSHSAEAIAINTDDRLDNIIAGEMQDAEVIDARRPFGGEAYPTLGERLDEDKAEVTAQLAQIATNAKAEGAKADGLINDALIIQTIINNVSTNGGGIVYLPKGTYRLTSPIYLKSNVILQGAGAGTVIKRDFINQSAIYIKAENSVNKIGNVLIRDLRITSVAKSDTSTAKDSAGISIFGSQTNPSQNGDQVSHTGETENISIQNVDIDNFINGLYLGINTFIDRAYIYKGLKIKFCTNGVYIDDWCEYSTITDSVIQKCAYGIFDNGASNCSYNNNHINFNSEAGIYLVKSGRNTNKKIISANHINHNKRGVWIDNGVGTVGIPITLVSILNNHIFANSWQGISCMGGSDNLITNNIIMGNGGGTIPDIYVENTCRRYTINNNMFQYHSSSESFVAINVKQPTTDSAFTYHRINNNTFIDYPIEKQVKVDNPIPSTAYNTNNNIIDGVFEYHNTVNTPPTDSSGVTRENVDFKQLPQGTICRNNNASSDNELWLLAYKKTSSLTPNEIVWAQLS